MSRLLSWFSCGAASTISSILCVETEKELLVEVVHCDTLKYEHPDNARYLKDAERLIGRPIISIRSSEYSDIWDVFERTRYLAGVKGARCTTELKKLVRRHYQRIDDVHAFGLTYDPREVGRANRMQDNNPDMVLRFPLIEAQMTKQDCLDYIQDAGVELPMMYRMGYSNNNCIGCVKGGAAYWNKIRRDFQMCSGVWLTQNYDLELRLLSTKVVECVW
jgi:3'-phosphoadenosine 5'-phosphosulfate sulfotransferase (PAPS reductase)/FAD synthetase